MYVYVGDTYRFTKTIVLACMEACVLVGGLSGGN